MPFNGVICGSQDFPWIFLQKGILFRRTTRGKSELSMDYAKESFSRPRKVIISLCKGLSQLLKLISNKNWTMGDQKYPTFVRKIIINMCWTKVIFLTFRRLSSEIWTSCGIFRRIHKKMKVLLDAQQGPMRCWSMKKKPRPKTLMLQSL
jgi:hypothetical protein